MAVTALYVLGALLVGGGVVSLVAWNWEALSAAAKLVLLGVALATVHTVGYQFWRFGNRKRLGHGLMFLGSVLFGAAMP